MKVRRLKKKLGALRRLFVSGYPRAAFVKSIRDTSRKKILLVGSPLHTNLGDHLLALSEIEYLENQFPEYEVLDVPTCLYLYRHGLISKKINKTDIVFISGGGWLGDVWPRDEMIMQDMVRTFQDKCSVFVFPQTIYYRNEASVFAEDAALFWRTLSNGVLSVREKKSFDFAKRIYGMKEGKVTLLPDAGLIYKSELTNNCEKRFDVLFCLRGDIEAMLHSADKQKLYSIVEELGLTANFTSTLEDKHFAYELREEKVKEKLREFSEAKVVITDRLHGMIFSLLVGTPCIALDNETKKVRGVYECWLQDIDSLFFYCDLDEVIDKLASFDFASERSCGLSRNHQDAWMEDYSREIERYLNVGDNKEVDSLSNPASNM